MIISELKKLKLQGELVSIERNCHDEELTGLISLVNEEIIAMNIYTDDGDFEGFTVFETGQITEVFWGNREHKAISNLVSKSKIELPVELESEDFQGTISELSKKFGNLCIHEGGNEDKYEIAEIDSMDDEWLKIHTYGIKRSLSRMYKILLRDSVSRIVVNSPYQNKIVGLHTEDL